MRTTDEVHTAGLADSALASRVGSRSALGPVRVAVKVDGFDLQPALEEIDGFWYPIWFIEKYGLRL